MNASHVSAFHGSGGIYFYYNSSYFSLSDVVITWEASNVTVSENVGISLPGGASSLCASIINPGINDSNQAVQIQVVTENFTAQGSLVQVKWYYTIIILSLLLQLIWTTYQSQ